MKLSIRKMVPSDIGVLAGMLGDLYDAHVAYPHYDADELEKLLFSLLSTMQHSSVLNLIAFDGKKAAGFMLGHLAKRESGTPHVVGVADELYVMPEKRNGQVGLRLIQEATRFALAAGAQAIEVVATMERSERWSKLGFKPYAQQLYMPIEEAKELFLDSKHAEAA